ncbi:MAG: translation initiation factor IF-2 [Spirochaetes bacterium RBG_16_67_19]|nr:MAG: translation initiation factor IF-2 [Spirochaetes bacterium RBG_16_67_19]
MAEEPKKPKATLIKHRKPPMAEPAPAAPEELEKKKIVVVKKKVVVVKKTAAPPIAGFAPVAKEAQPEPKVVPVGPPREPPPAVPSETESVTLEQVRRSQPPVRPPLPQERDRRPPPRYGRPEYRPPGGDFRRPGGPPGGGYRGPGGPPRPYDRRPGPGGPRPYDRRPGGPPPRPAPSTGTGTDKAGAGKKVFKAKKKADYSKNRFEEHQEKVLSQKKKLNQKINPVPREIAIMEVITVSELARKMNLKASELISKLMSMGMMVTINQQIDAETATLLAAEYSCKVKIVSLYEETIIATETDKAEDLRPRPPIVTVMGHVDHGKTKLLDAIRTTNVVDSEFGGITQHIGAYTVDVPQGRIVFLDTPGHEAFTFMRARGAQITDLVILVVAANDGVMPQTVEAISHAKAAKVPIIVAVNKIDLPEANVERVKKQLAEHGLIPETWGGHTQYCEISALKRQGIKELLDAILLQSEILELKASYEARAEGRIVESKIDFGRGIVATALIQRGTLRVGDSFVAGVYPGKVRALFSDKGEKLEESTPSIPVEILGFTGIPNAGDPFQVTESEKEARQIGAKRQELKKHEESKNIKKVTLDTLYDKIKDGEIRELKIIIKGDVHGSVEALQNSLEKLSTSEVRLNVLHAGAGAIDRSDVLLASTYSAIIVGFNVRPTPATQHLADSEKVEIRKYNIIYNVIDEIKAAMEGMLAPSLEEQTIGTAEVRDLFKIPKIGIIAGCHVTDGVMRRNASVRLVRDGVVIYTGKITSLKRFKEDAREVEAGYECGIGVENYNDLKAGDILEAFEIIKKAKTLQGPGSDVGSKAKEG